MKPLLLAFALTLSIPALVRAQDPPKAEAFGGYSYFRADGVRWPRGDFYSLDPIDTDQHGWAGSFAWNVTDHLAIEGDVSGHYKGEGAYRRDFSIGSAGSLGIGVESKTRTHAFMGGPKVLTRIGRATPFAHVLLGAVRRSEARSYSWGVLNFPCQGTSCDVGLNPFSSTLTETSFGVALGGGLDITVTDRIAVRVVQADYVRTGFRDETQDNLRVSTGVVFRFGER